MSIMPTTEQIQAGTSCKAATAERWQKHLQFACDAYQINTPKRLAAFLAQIGHESGYLQYVKEIWGPTIAQKRYEGREDLGNVFPGDGKKYMGRGLIQMTGRNNYIATRDGLRKIMTEVPDFEEFPEYLETPPFAALSAAWYWFEHGLNELADRGEFEKITRRINGGFNGYADRLALYNKAMKALA